MTRKRQVRWRKLRNRYRRIARLYGEYWILAFTKRRWSSKRRGRKSGASSKSVTLSCGRPLFDREPLTDITGCDV